MSTPSTTPVNRPASESAQVLQAIHGRSFEDTVARLKRIQWKIVSSVKITNATFSAVARSHKRYMQLYGKYGRVWTANFGRRDETSTNLPPYEGGE